MGMQLPRLALLPATTIGLLPSRTPRSVMQLSDLQSKYGKCRGLPSTRAYSRCHWAIPLRAMLQRRCTRLAIRLSRLVVRLERGRGAIGHAAVEYAARGGRRSGVQ